MILFGYLGLSDLYYKKLKMFSSIVLVRRLYFSWFLNLFAFENTRVSNWISSQNKNHIYFLEKYIYLTMIRLK